MATGKNTGNVFAEKVANAFDGFWNYLETLTHAQYFYTYLLGGGLYLFVVAVLLSIDCAKNWKLLRAVYPVHSSSNQIAALYDYRVIIAKTCWHHPVFILRFLFTPFFWLRKLWKMEFSPLDMNKLTFRVCIQAWIEINLNTTTKRKDKKWEEKVKARGWSKEQAEEKWNKKLKRARWRDWEILIKNPPEGDSCIHIRNYDQLDKELLRNYIQSLYQVSGKKQKETLWRFSFTDGYVGPLYLITGLCERFSDQWTPIITNFRIIYQETKQQLDHKLNHRLDARTETGFRHIFYHFNCWLMWGPSIKFGSCDIWMQKKGEAYRHDCPVQFGYGDENNSLIIVYPAAKSSRYAFTNEFVDAVRKVEGHLSLECVEKEEKIGRCKGEIHLHEKLAVSHDNRDAVLLVGKRGEAPEMDTIPESPSESQRHASHYYSGYFWVGFVLCTINPSGISEPLFAGTDKWRGFLPLFEHGNFADSPQGIHMLKKQLAIKAVAAMEDIYEHLPFTKMGDDLSYKELLDAFPTGTITDLLQGKNSPAEIVKALRNRLGQKIAFHYAGAIDEPGCDGITADGNGLVRGYMQEIIATRNLDYILLKHNSIWVRDYHSCYLPEMVKDYYLYLKEKDLLVAATEQTAV